MPRAAKFTMPWCCRFLRSVARIAGDVLAPVGERRQVHGHDVEPVIEILAEAAGGDLVGQDSRGRGDDAHVDLDGALAADPNEALIGQHAQDLALGRERHVGDLVEEERAAMRLLEQARAGELAALLAAEQFLLDPFGRHPRRGDDDERAVGARAPIVQEPRGDLLADARPARRSAPGCRSRPPASASRGHC